MAAFSKKSILFLCLWTATSALTIVACGERVADPAAPAPPAARQHPERVAAAAERLPAATQNLTEQRNELANDAYEVRRLIAQACQGVPAPAAGECPIGANNLTSARVVTDGVVVRVTPIQGAVAATAQLVSCYHARVEARAAERGVGPASSVSALQGGRNTGTQAGLRSSSDVRVRPVPATDVATAAECLLDVQGLEVDVAPSGDHVDVHLIADNDAEMIELRRRAADLTASQRLTRR